MFKPHLLFTLIAFALWLPSQTAFAQSPPTRADADRERGIDFYREGKTDEAIQALKAAIRENQTDLYAWYYLGLAQIRLGKFNDARKSLNKAALLQPEFAPAHLALALVALQRNKLAEAADEAERVLAIEPNNVEAHYLLGLTRLREGNKEEALKQSEAAELDPRFAAAYLLKSQAYVSFLERYPISERTEPSAAMKARFGQAANALETFLQLEPNPEDKQTWLDQLESLSFHSTLHDENGTERVYAGKEVTTKARVTNKPEPQYTDEARGRGTTGRVVLRCVFAADGLVKYLLIVQGLPNGLTERALAAARLIKFQPAIKDGHPVSMYIQLEYNFNLY